MKRLAFLLLCLMLIFTVSFADDAERPSGLLRTVCGTYYKLSEPLPVITSVEINGMIYLVDSSQQDIALLSDTCETCDMQLGNRAAHMDGWYRYTATHHQYRTYYYATCVNCNKTSFVFTQGDLGSHQWTYVSDRHAWDDLHAIVENCKICGEGMTSYVFCPGPLHNKLQHEVNLE